MYISLQQNANGLGMYKLLTFFGALKPYHFYFIITQCFVYYFSRLAMARKQRIWLTGCFRMCEYVQIMHWWTNENLSFQNCFQACSLICTSNVHLPLESTETDDPRMKPSTVHRLHVHGTKCYTTKDTFTTVDDTHQHKLLTKMKMLIYQVNEQYIGVGSSKLLTWTLTLHNFRVDWCKLAKIWIK